MAASRLLAAAVSSPFEADGDEEEEDVSEEAKEAKFLKALQKGKLNEQRLNGTYMDQQVQQG